MIFEIPDKFGHRQDYMAWENSTRIVISAHYMVADSICFLHILYSDGNDDWFTTEQAFTYCGKTVSEVGFVKLPPTHTNDTKVCLDNVSYPPRPSEREPHARRRTYPSVDNEPTGQAETIDIPVRRSETHVVFGADTSVPDWGDAVIERGENGMITINLPEGTVPY